MKKLLVGAFVIAIAGVAHAEFCIPTMNASDIKRLDAGINPGNRPSPCRISKKGGEASGILPVFYKSAKFSIGYEITRDKFTANLIATRDGQPWYTQVIYSIQMDPNLEADVQLDFVTSMEVENGKLVITTKKGRLFNIAIL